MAERSEGGSRHPLPLAGRLWGLSSLAAAWLFVAALSVGLQWLLDGSALATKDLPVALRWELLAWELELLACLVFGLGGLLLLLAAGCRRWLGPAATSWGRWGAILCVGLAVGLYAGSWASFVNSGQFLDVSVLGFMSENGVQFFQHAIHIDPGLSVGIPISLVVLTLLLCIAIPRWMSRVGTAFQLGIIGLAATALAVCLVLSPGEPNIERATDRYAPEFRPNRGVSDPDAGLVYTESDLLMTARNERSGPVSHVFAEWVGWDGQSGRKFLVDEDIGIRRLPILTMDDWLAEEDLSRVPRWNVIVAVVESLRSDQLRAFGGLRDVMPNVDAIANQGLVFPDHFTQASHSNYADMALLSSHYPLRAPRTHLYPKDPSYPRVLVYDVLKHLGWHTAVVSSQNENWGRMINYLKTGNIDHFFHSEDFEGPTYVPRNDTGFETFMKGGKRSGKIDDRFTVDEAMRWIGSVPEADPFFLYLNLQNSHLPYETPADFPRRFGPDSIPFTIRFGGFPRSQVQTVKDIYADSLAYVDHQLGRLVDFLKETGRWDRTLLVITGDTGQAFYEHGFVAHANMVFNEVMHVPLVVRIPGGGGKVDQRPAQHIDIPPTVLDLMGLPAHPAFQGVSLVEKSPDYGRSRYIMAQAPLAHQYAVIKDRFKLLYDMKRNSTMLIDLKADPDERDNIATENLAVTTQLRRRLDTWRKHQLDYYRDVGEHSRNYPPVLED